MAPKLPSVSKFDCRHMLLGWSVLKLICWFPGPPFLLVGQNVLQLNPKSALDNDQANLFKNYSCFLVYQSDLFKNSLGDPLEKYMPDSSCIRALSTLVKF